MLQRSLCGMHYLSSQFVESDNPRDACSEAHWHTPYSDVFPFETLEKGIEDPHPMQCGFGTVKELPLSRHALPIAAYGDYCKLHIERCCSLSSMTWYSFDHS